MRDGFHHGQRGGVNHSGDEGEERLDFPRLETDHYVRQIKHRRGQLLAQIDSTPAERLRRKVGYEIERRYGRRESYIGLLLKICNCYYLSVLCKM